MPDPKQPETLTRQQMEAVIKSGGSVLHNGRIISRAEELPTAVQLAQTDEQREAAKKALEQQRADVDHQLQQLAEAASKQVERPAELRDAPPEKPDPKHAAKK